MHRKPSAVLFLLALLLSAAGAPAFGACTAGNANPNAIETTPSAEFTVNGDGTLTHAKTGLMWKQCAEGRSGAGCATGAATTTNWAGALGAAKAANAANGGLGFAGHTDWRLPNPKELQSIVESCGSIPSINQVMFPATPASFFWSASSYVEVPAWAWTVLFSNGGSSAYGKTLTYYVRLVRGGQSLDSFDSLNVGYSVTYDANGATGGSVPVDGNAYTPGAPVAVPANAGALVKTNYLFAGWNTVANDSGTSYSAGDTLTMGSANVTLYAQWRQGLADTGQDKCYDGTGTLAPCTTANTGDAATYPRQDGRFGRDAKAAAGTLAKAGAGAAGFDYTKVGNNGSDLAAGAAQGTNPTDWACTRDNATNLTWEVKTTSGNDLRYFGHNYDWYSTNNATNGGHAGGVGSNTCGGTLPANQCNTQAFVNAVNAAALCSYTDWRLPTHRELLTLAHYGAANPSIDTTYFPNTAASVYWTASTRVQDPSVAWVITFDAGTSSLSSKAFDHAFVRLVRGGQF